MTPQYSREAVKQIEMMFGKEFSGAARNQLIEDLQREHTDAVVDAIKILEREHSFLPAPIALLRIVRQCAAAKADRKQDQRVREERKMDPEGFKVFQAMNRLFFSGNITRRQILEKIRQADQMKPSAGWASCGASLQRYYEEKGFDLDKAPASALRGDVQV